MVTSSNDILRAHTDDDAAARQQAMLWNSVWETLQSYLKNDSKLTLVDAVDQVNQCWHDTSDYKVVVLTVPIRIAKQTPYDGPIHSKLAELMLALDSKRSESAPPREQGVDELGDFTIYLYDDFNFSHPDLLASNTTDDGVSDPVDPMMYANLCAFIANMVFSNGHIRYGLAKSALVNASKIDPKASVEVRSAWIIGAAQFIIHQAPAIFKDAVNDRNRVAKMTQSKSFLARLGFGKRQQLHDPDMIVLWEDWENAKLAFSAAAVDETLSITCRDIAQQAADTMALQEKIEDDRAGR